MHGLDGGPFPWTAPSLDRPTLDRPTLVFLLFRLKFRSLGASDSAEKVDLSHMDLQCETENHINNVNEPRSVARFHVFFI